MGQKESQALWYQKNKERHKANVAPRRISNRKQNEEFINNLKESNPCTDCQNYYPYYVMDFDHLRDKYRTINQMAGFSRKSLLEELAKCELVCKLPSS